MCEDKLNRALDEIDELKLRNRVLMHCLSIDDDQQLRWYLRGYLGASRSLSLDELLELFAQRLDEK